MKLREIDKRPIYIANLVGFDLSNNPIYKKAEKVFAQVNDLSGKIIMNDYGLNDNYRLKVLFEFNDKTKYINEFTRLWVVEKPNDSEDNFDYLISRKLNWERDILEVYLKPVDQDFDMLFTYNESYGIYTFQCLYDEANKTITLPENSLMKINSTTKIWTEEPVDESTTENKIKLVNYKKKDGFIIYYME